MSLYTFVFSLQELRSGRLLPFSVVLSELLARHFYTVQNPANHISRIPEIVQIVKFCDDDRDNPETMHNYNAPSRHNRLCGHRSTWSVIAGSEDFKNGRNPPREGMDTMPVFTIVQAPGTPRLVLALDTSSSMSVRAPKTSLLYYPSVLGWMEWYSWLWQKYRENNRPP